METKTGKSTSFTAHGKKLKTPVPYTFDYRVWSNADDLRATGWPKDEDIVKFVNADELAKARSTALASALEAAGIVKATAEEDPQVGLRDMARTIRTAKNADGSRKYTEEQVRQIASATIGVDWED